MQNNKQTLPNLNGLRFIAAATVLFSHIDYTMVDNGYKLKNLFIFPFVHGTIAVICFFVLSGFLITYLLLKEKAKTGSIAIKSFYLKRVLRIWPLYFLIIILSIFFLNNNSFFASKSVTDVINFKDHPIAITVFILLISPNIAVLFSNTLGYANPSWSIGVEEQFYLIWPWIMRKKNYLSYLFGIIMVMYLLSKDILKEIAYVLIKVHVLKNESGTHNFILKFNSFFAGTYPFHIDAMAIGALGAHLVISKNETVLKTIFSKKFQMLLYTVLAISLTFCGNIAYQFFSLLFMLMIVNLACNSNSIIRLENKVFDYLGKISYGIYMFHMLSLIPTLKLVFGVWKMQVNIASELLCCGIALIITVAISSISYYLFERYFLKLKDRFA